MYLPIGNTRGRLKRLDIELTDVVILRNGGVGR